MTRSPMWLLSLTASLGCHRDKEGSALPAAGALEAVSLPWDGGEFPGSHPSVVRFDDAWHLYLTAAEGSFVGPVHATSDDGINFTLESAHRLLDDLTSDADTTCDSVVSYTSGSRVHLLANITSGTGSTVRHATSTDGTTFTLDEDRVFGAASPSTVAVTGAVYEAASVTALLVQTDGSDDATTIDRATSTDGGTTFSTASVALQPDDLPTPWGSGTVGAGGMWGGVIVVQEDGSYNMLYLGAAPNGTSALGIGQAWSGDGEVWASDGDLWYEPEAGQTIHGMSLATWEGGYELWLSLAPSDADPLESGALYHMRFE